MFIHFCEISRCPELCNIKLHCSRSFEDLKVWKWWDYEIKLPACDRYTVIVLQQNEVLYWEIHCQYCGLLGKCEAMAKYVEYLVCVIGRAHWKAVYCNNFFNSLLHIENYLIASISFCCVSGMFSTKHFNIPSNTTTCLLFKNNYMFQS